MKITLYYFKIPFWRAEVTRLSLYISDIPFNDHRIAMAFSIASLLTNDHVEIDNSKCVSISYPNFFDHIKRLTS